MTDTISIAVICGSLRQGSFNAAIAREFSTLAPTGISFHPLDGMESIPHYNADIQSQGCPAIVLDWAEIIRSSDALCSSHRNTITRSPAF
jgi:chromate reductase